jgi:synaptic vesicle membrane protein VAT-1
MHKIVVHKAGSYDRLVYEQHPDPQPGDGQALVDVAAASVNFADCAVRMGIYASAKEYVGWPITPGFDFAGTVVALGPGSDDSLSVGDRVFGVAQFGAYTDRIAVPTAQLMPLPEDWTLEQGAAFPVVNLTAWYALVLMAGARPGETMLVHSAAGGVGGAALALAGRMGLRRIGVVGREQKEAIARARGADEVIVRARDDLWSRVEELAPEGIDVLLDSDGGPGLRPAYRHLAAGGRLVVYGAATMLKRGKGKPDWPKLVWSFLRTPRFHPLDMTNNNKSVLAFNLSFLFPRVELLRRALTELLAAHADGDLPHPEITTFALKDAAEAHRTIETGNTTGKLVLVTG